MAENYGAPDRIRTCGLCLRREGDSSENSVKTYFSGSLEREHARNKPDIQGRFTGITPEPLSPSKKGEL